jgi:hypothetical protein
VLTGPGMTPGPLSILPRTICYPDLNNTNKRNLVISRLSIGEVELVDDRKFDTLARRLGSAQNRRSLLKGVIGMAGIATAGAFVHGQTNAARRGFSGPTFFPTEVPTAVPTSDCIPAVVSCNLPPTGETVGILRPFMCPFENCCDFCAGETCFECECSTTFTACAAGICSVSVQYPVGYCGNN